MKSRPRWSHVTIALGVIAALAIASPVFGLSKSIKKAINKEVAKQISKATGPAGANGTARAYGQVSPGGVVTRSKNVIGNATGPTGIYCLKLAAGIDPSTTGLVATPDYNTDSTSPPDATAHVEFNSDSSDCPGGTIEVKGFNVDTSATTAVTDPQGGTVAAPTYKVSASNEGFFFVVP
jgi:hypothetical protein